jgi:hypothetical protein
VLGGFSHDEHMGHPPQVTRQPLPERQRAEIARFVQKNGERWTLQALELTRHTFGRIVGGLTVTAGTRALVSQRLAALHRRRAAGPAQPAAGR